MVYRWGGVEALLYNGQPFTGIAQFYTEDGILYGEDEYHEGYQEGWKRFYFPNGQLQSEYKTHNNDRISNTWSEFDEDGNILKDSW